MFLGREASGDDLHPAFQFLLLWRQALVPHHTCSSLEPPPLFLQVWPTCALSLAHRPRVSASLGVCIQCGTQTLSYQSMHAGCQPCSLPPSIPCGFLLPACVFPVLTQPLCDPSSLKGTRQSKDSMGWGTASVHADQHASPVPTCLLRSPLCPDPGAPVLSRTL